MPHTVIAIDGPAGVGKSTASRQLAARLGFTYIDTGAMYRSVAYLASRLQIPMDDASALAAIAVSLNFEFQVANNSHRTYVNGEDLSTVIRTLEVSTGASIVAKHPPVVDALIEKQRAFAERSAVVMEGRNIGTAVFPHATVKFFLIASEETRAMRRVEELRQKGTPIAFETVLKEAANRDTSDKIRPYAGIKKADDAIEIATDQLTLDQVVDLLESLVRERLEHS